jgi:S1-C subfamily serine protease
MKKIISSLMLVGTLASCTSTQKISTVVEEKEEIKINFIVINDILYWKGNDEKLNFIYDLSLLKGKDGKDGKDGLDGKNAESAVGSVSGGAYSPSFGGAGGFINSSGTTGPVGPVGPEGPAGKDGKDGAQIQLRYNENENKVEWKYENTNNWQVLFNLNTLQETSAVYIFEPEFRSTETHFQMRNNSTDEWRDIFAFPIFTQPEPIIVEPIIIYPKTLEAIVKDVHESIVRISRTGGHGSGVIYKKEGNVYNLITNSHVIGDATDITITINKFGNIYDFTNVNIVGKDPSTDLAVLSFSTNFNLPVVEFDDSNNLEVGEVVFAIGNPTPIGILYNTVTNGIVSGLNRMITQGLIKTNGYVQHSAAINAGNSGGGLFNSYGKLIGINTLKARPYLDFENISLAVVSNIVKRVVLDLEEFQTTTNLSRVNFGITSFVNLQNENCNSEYGVCISTVHPDKVSNTKGLVQYDVIVGFKNARMNEFVNVYNNQQFNELLVQTRIGENIQIKYLRNGEEYTTNPINIGG